MKALLTHRDHDFDSQRASPANEAVLTKDLELDTLFSAMAGLSRFRLANQRIGFLRFAACADSQGVWHGGKVSGYGER